MEVDDEDRGRSGYHSGGEADFYYTSGRPYSRSYGPLVQREGRYYYSRGGSSVVYDRPTTVYRSERSVVRRDGDVRVIDSDRRGGGYESRQRYNDDRGMGDDGRSVRRMEVYRSNDVRSGDGRSDYHSSGEYRGGGGTSVRVIER